MNLANKVEGYDGYADMKVSTSHYENTTMILAAVWIIENYYQCSYNWLKSKTSRHDYLGKQIGKGLIELLKGFKQTRTAMESIIIKRKGQDVIAADSFEDDLLFTTSVLDRTLSLTEQEREELLSYIDNTYFKEVLDGNN